MQYYCVGVNILLRWGVGSRQDLFVFQNSDKLLSNFHCKHNKTELFALCEYRIKKKKKNEKYFQSNILHILFSIVHLNVLY